MTITMTITEVIIYREHVISYCELKNKNRQEEEEEEEEEEDDDDDE